MRNLADVLDQGEISASVQTELTTSRRLLPTSTHHLALVGRLEEVSEWVGGSLSSEWHPSHEQVVAASKARHGVRPIAVWDLRSAVVYRALTNRLALKLPPLVRSGSAWTQFQREPLDRPGKYIVSADIAACYQMLDHGELSRELTVQTGEGRTVEHIIELVQAVSGRSYGIPQQSLPSDVLAEVFLAALERRILRKGLDITRYNDDFRVNCESWSEVVRAIETLSEEARSMGLLLNDSKVLTYKRVTYEGKLNKADALREEIANDAELDLTDYLETYDGDFEEITPEQTAIDQLAAVRVLERWQSVAGRGQVRDSKRAEHAALVQLVPVALRELGKSSIDAPKALDISMNLLRFEQTTTPGVCEFFTGRQDDAALLASFDKLLARDVYLTGWQAWWLQQPLARLDLTTGKGSRRRTEWLEDLFKDAQRSPVLRANAAKTMARHKLITVETLLRVYDRSSAVERPVVVEAMALLKPGKAVRAAVTGDSKLEEWAFDWALQNA